MIQLSHQHFIRSNCDSVILPKYSEKIKGKEQEFCPRCECKYENRNTTVIKVSQRVFSLLKLISFNSILGRCYYCDMDHFVIVDLHALPQSPRADPQ